MHIVFLCLKSVTVFIKKILYIYIYIYKVNTAPRNIELHYAGNIPLKLILNGTDWALERLQNKLDCLILTSAREKNQGILETGHTHVSRERGEGYLFLIFHPFIPPEFKRLGKLRAGRLRCGDRAGDRARGAPATRAVEGRGG